MVSDFLKIRGAMPTNYAENTTEMESPVECLIGFVAETTILSIKRATDDTIPAWYHAVSNQAIYQDMN